MSPAIPTNDSTELIRCAIRGLKQIFLKGYHYKKVGVIVMELTPQSSQQLPMFNLFNPRSGGLMKAIDKINSKTGVELVKFAIQDYEQRFKMNQNYLSPKFTTRLSDIIKVKG